MKKFDFEEFIQFIKWERNRLNTHFKIIPNSREETFVRMTKLMEECGEFANEILTYKSLVRNEKLGENSDKLANEFADVLMVLFIIADGLNINFEEAIKSKMDIIKSREF